MFLTGSSRLPPNRPNLDELVGIALGQSLSTPAPVDALTWIEQNFFLYDTANLITLFECQRRPLELAMQRDIDGNFRFNTILWSWPKKSAKSSVIAAVADNLADTRPRAQVKLVANDLKQADSRVGFYIRESIKLSQRNGKRTGIKMTPSGYKIEYANGARIDMVPIDPAGEAGGNDDMIVYSELWGWKSKAHQRMWSEMTLSPTKFGNSQRWIDTYAGFKGESPILEQLYQTGVVDGYQVWDDLEVYVNESAKMLTVWVTKPMFPWQTEAYYTEQRATLTPSEFDRMHRNQWVTSTDTFVPPEWWDACGKTPPPALDQNEPVILAMDAGVSSDCFAIVMVGRRGDIVQVYYPRAWKPQGGALDFRPIEAEVRRLINTYNVIELTYDPFQLHDMATRIRAEESVNVRPFNQASPRAVADKLLFDLIRDRRIQHNNEPDLREHVINANRKPEDDKLRIIKRDVNMKIDLCVALSMGAARTFAYASDE